MLIVFVSLVTTLILASVLLTLVHYAIVSWEQDRVNNLSKQIRSESTEDNILNRPTSSHKFTNVDLKTSLRWSGEVKSIRQTASNWYSKTITLIQTQDYVGWWEKIRVELEKLKKDWWTTLKNWWHFLLSLAQPLNTDITAADSNKNQSLKEEKQKREIAEVVTKIKQTNDIESADLPKNNNIRDASDSFEIFVPSSVEAPKPKTNLETNTIKPTNATQFSKEDQVATLNLATSTDQYSREKNNDFDRLEKKILERLQESGWQNYDIWLQLGDFYSKYNETKKAKEIFALVLKHASGETKEIARNRLLSL